MVIINKLCTKKKKRNLGVLTSPMGKANLSPLLNLIDITSSLANNLFLLLVHNEDVQVHKPENQSIKAIHTIVHKSNQSIIKRILVYIRIQIKVSWLFLKLSFSVDGWIFYVGETLLLQTCLAKLLRRKVIIIIVGSIEKELSLKKDKLGTLLMFLRKITLTLSDRLVVYSTSLVKNWKLEKYKYKISIASEHFLDFKNFTVQEDYSKRAFKVGFIGRLSEEKGVINYLQAILQLSKKEGADGEKKYNGLLFFIGGDGHLRKNVEEILNMKNINEKLQYVGWIPHEKLPEYLNQLKLLVLPSYTEGLPNIMLEAMACCTPVLATTVGVIPDIIKDGETGFILEDNSPEAIAKGIIRALNHPNLEQVAANARALVEREYNFVTAIKKWQTIFDEILVR